MSNPPDSSHSDITDAMWAQYGASARGRDPASPSADGAPLAADCDDPAMTRRLLGYLVIVAAVGVCGFLMLARWGAGPEWPAGVYCGLAAAGGFLLAPRRRLSGLLGGAVAGAGSMGATAWFLEHPASANPGLACGAALAGLIPAVGVHFVLRFLQLRVKRGKRQDQSARAAHTVPHAPFTGGSTPASGPSMDISYEPPPSEPPDPREATLEERLLLLCKQDKRLLQRLLDHERRCQPHLTRADLLRLAIAHYERDNG